MTAQSSLSLQEAIIARLRDDAGVTALLGGPHVHDHVPRAASPPYVALARFDSRDLSSSTVAGAEHAIRLHIWPEGQGRKDAHQIANAIETALAMPLTLAGAHLVNLAVVNWQVERVGKDRYRGVLNLRAVTELE
jgi:hypothetical protein